MEETAEPLSMAITRTEWKKLKVIPKTSFPRTWYPSWSYRWQALSWLSSY